MEVRSASVQKELAQQLELYIATDGMIELAVTLCMYLIQPHVNKSRLSFKALKAKGVQPFSGKVFLTK